MMGKIGKLLFIGVLFAAINSANAQNNVVLISTNYGDMKFKLYDDTPKHRDAFLDLAFEGYYDGTLFYRVIQNFLIQGGSASSRNAPPGKMIGYGDPDKTVDDEIVKTHFHKKGALCAPRQPDEKNPFKQSDISQFYIVKGSVFTSGRLDSMELVINRPIRNRIVKRHMNDDIREKLKQLKKEKKVKEFRAIADEVKEKIETDFNLSPGILVFTPEQREAYTTVGGYPELDGNYTIFGECIEGFEVIDKIASLKTDKNNRPLQDVKIKVKILQ